MNDAKINYDEMTDDQRELFDKAFIGIAQVAIDLEIMSLAQIRTKTFHLLTRDEDGAVVSAIVELIKAVYGCRKEEELSAIGILDDGEEWCDDCIWSRMDECKNGQDLIDLILHHRNGVEKGLKDSGITKDAIKRQINDPTGYQAYLASQNNNKSNQPG